MEVKKNTLPSKCNEQSLSHTVAFTVTLRAAKSKRTEHKLQHYDILDSCCCCYCKQSLFCEA